jgi:AraC family transcriptional activator of pobA
MNELFRIFKVDLEEVQRLSAGANPPHHHDYEELIVAAQGSLEHFIDFRTEVLDAPFVSFVTKGKVHRVKPAMKDGACDMWVLRFKSEFIPETTFQLYSLYHDNANIPLKEARCFVRLTLLCEMIAGEMGTEGAGSRRGAPAIEHAVHADQLGTSQAPSGRNITTCHAK